MTMTIITMMIMKMLCAHVHHSYSECRAEIVTSGMPRKDKGLPLVLNQT